uniref:Uncharacterized protein n=1 Tax=Fagus sylvatica TaxID=28930 RepID=A0A2N9G063_FAGSY
MAGETRGLNKQKVRMAALEHKFDDLLALVHMMVKRDAETGNQKRKDDKNTNGEVSEGRPHINMDPLPRPPTPPKPEGKDSQIDGKIDSLEGEDQAHAGFELFREHRLLQYVLVPQHDKCRPNSKSQNFEKNNGRSDPMIHLQIRMVFTTEEDLPLERAGRHLPSPFLVDLILVEERVEDAVKTKRMVDMLALMELESGRKTLPMLYPLGVSQESVQISTSSQGAQDLNDLLGLLKGAVFVRRSMEEPAAATSR